VGFSQRAGETAAHQISVLTAIAAFAGYFSMLQRRWPIRDADEVLKVGSAWLDLTACVEFGRPICGMVGSPEREKY
jgi:hypothetical protein